MKMLDFRRLCGQRFLPNFGNSALDLQFAGTWLITAKCAGMEPSSRESGGLARAEGGAYIMGTIFNVVAYGANYKRLESAICKALDEARRLDQMFSNYRPGSELSRINRSASKRPMEVSGEFFQFLSACAEYSRASEGTFDITVGPLMKVSDLYKGTGRLPDRNELALAQQKVGYQNVLLDEKQMTVNFARDEIELDPGGIGKGFAVDKMAEILKRDQVSSALISAGGSTIYALGAPPNKPGWKVNIKDPRHPSKTVETVRLKNESISTSGNYEKSFWADGKIWSHIMDPRTGYPAMGTLSVSIIAPQTVDSEAWAKPYYILGRAWAARHKPPQFRVFYCEDKPGTPCAWIE
jgi:FAD:protein FMN transferase